MVDHEIRNEIRGLWKGALELAGRSLEKGDSEAYRTLTETAERLARLSTPFIEKSVGNKQDGGEVSGTLVAVSAKYKGQHYDARLDPARINGGHGPCLLFHDKWVTVSAAAVSITGNAVNGWRFWKYKRSDGNTGLIDELRTQGG